MTRVMEHSQTRGVTRLVLLVIANHETEDRGAFPAIDRLAREAGSGVRTVQECIRRAEAAGELEVRYRQGPHGTNLYRVLSGLAATATLPGTESTRSRTPQNPHPADTRRESAPERKEQGLTLSVASSSSQPTSAQDKPAPNGAYPAAFEEFWAVYPLKVGKRAALKRWKEALRRADQAVILAGAVRYRDDPRRDPDKTKHAEGWLNADRWDDQPPSPKPEMGSDEWAAANAWRLNAQ